MKFDYIVVYVTVPDEESGERVIEALLDKRHAACASMIKDVRSIYPWKGERQDDRELLLIIKSRRDRFPDIIRAVRGVHPYETPEIIAMPIIDGNPDYLSWIDENVS